MKFCVFYLFIESKEPCLELLVEVCTRSNINDNTQSLRSSGRTENGGSREKSRSYPLKRIDWLVWRRVCISFTLDTSSEPLIPDHLETFALYCWVTSSSTVSGWFGPCQNKEENIFNTLLPQLKVSYITTQSERYHQNIYKTKTFNKECYTIIAWRTSSHT